MVNTTEYVSCASIRDDIKSFDMVVVYKLPWGGQ